MLDRRLDLPGPWCQETTQSLARREEAHIPEGVASATEARVAAELVRGVEMLGREPGPPVWVLMLLARSIRESGES